MKEKNKEKTFSQNIGEILEYTESLEAFPDSIVSNSAHDIKRNARDLLAGLKGMRLLLITMAIITAICIIVTLFCVENYYIMKDPENTKNKLLDISDDGYIEYITYNGKIVTYQQLVKKKDSLSDEINKRDDLLNMIKGNYGIKIQKKDKDGVESYTIYSDGMNKKSEITYYKGKSIIPNKIKSINTDSINNK
ncbi:hypothetical protein HZP64_14255 [Elizabethkingia anophelis]|nr:hypothetical protein [Elizabethkingia anophelis]